MSEKLISILEACKSVILHYLVNKQVTRSL